MKENNKNIIPNEDDFNISITNEHNEQELTSMGETGKSSGIISAINFPHFNISFTNKNKLYNKPFEQKEDNYSMYTNIKKMRSNNSIVNDEMFLEVRINKFIISYNFQYRKLLTILEKKENDKKALIQIYNQKMINYSNLKAKISENKEKLDLMRRKNEYMKLLIFKLMNEKK